MHKNLVHAQDSCACTRFSCTHKILVHAQDSCACKRILCMHKNLVLAQESWACTEFLGMHRALVHSGACTEVLSVHKNLVHAQESCARTRFLCMQFLSLFGLICWADLLGSICPLFVAICCYFQLFAATFPYSPLFPPIRRYFKFENMLPRGRLRPTPKRWAGIYHLFWKPLLVRDP